tara:strand:- start:6771 stop:8102 length:1332 start_codon:yes stop_codon:yes gene_type:complete
MKKLILVCISTCFFATIYAQEKTQQLSLKEAITYALKNSYGVKAAQNDILLAQKKVWETTTIGLPQITGALGYQNFLQQPVTLADFDQDGADDPFVFGTKQNMNASVTMNQLLFDGSYIVGLQAAKTYLKISEQATEKTAMRTKEAVINAYGNVLVTENSILVLEGNIEVLQQNYTATKEIYKNGFNEEEDVEQLEITLGNLKNQLNSISRMKSIAYQMLNLAMGNEIDTKIILTDTLDSLTKANISLALISQDFKVSNHIDFKISENNRETKRLMMRLEQSKGLPTLTAFLNYGAQANSDSFTFLNGNQRWYDSSLLGVNLSIPIFTSFGGAAKIAQAKIALDTADLRLIETKQRLSLQAQKTKNDYQVSIENYQTSKKNVHLAERIEKKQRVKFFEGISSSFDLLQAQNQLYTQQQNYIQSMLAVIANKATLENALNIPTK